MFKSLHLLLPITFYSFGFLLITSNQSQAQVTSDSTVNTQVTQNGNISEVTGGETRGGNLFHSFQDFSVGTGNEAFFNNTSDISNIFSRVTGGNISNINGLIRANGDASLFLLNPAGIIFGQNARLNIGGSFYSSTADSILFEDGEFSATDLDNPPVLTINAPIGLGFRDNPADITVRGDGNGIRTTDSEIINTQDALQVAGDATIGFIGGNLNFASATVKTAGGSIELGSVAGGRVDLIEAANGFSFDYSRVETFRDISLSGTTAIDGSGNGGGNINIAGRNITLADLSQIEASTLGDEAGDVINVFATDEISISGIENENNVVSAFVNQVYPNATADGGDINLETGSLSLGDRSGIFTNSSGQGNAGNIDINASDSVSLESQGNTSAILSGINADGSGAAGNITISTLGDVSLLNNSILASAGRNNNSGNIEINASSLTVNNSPIAISAASLGAGKGGNVSINTTNDIAFSNSSSIGVAGTPGGTIDINAKNLSLASGSTFFAGAGVDSEISNAMSGDIVINLSEDLVLDGAGNIESLTSIDNSNGGQGNAGNIAFNARNIEVLNGANISSGTLNNGNIGNITINASENIRIDGFNELTNSRISNLIGLDATGNTGEIRISAQNLTLTNSGSIQSLVQGRANSGDINLDISDTIAIEGFAEFTSTRDVNDTFRLSSGIDSNVGLGAVGSGGDININTKNLFISKNGEISTDIVAAQGTGGDISINAELVTIGEQENPLLSKSSISSSTSRSLTTEEDSFTQATAGNIEINTDSLFIREGAEIDASTSNLGNAGNITINATDTISVSGSSVLIPSDGEEVEIFSNIASAVILDGIGDGGEITINTSELSLDDGLISASTDGEGNAGNIALNASESVALNNEGIIASNVANPDDTTGNGGNLEINTPQLTINNNSQINAFTRGQGNAGSIDIKVDELSIDDGAINSLTEGEGNAGNLTISANEFIQLSNNSGIDAGTRINSSGNGGSLAIETKRLNADDSSQISVITFGQGNAGNLTINASEFINLSGTSDNGRSGLFASALEENGNGGNLQISTGDLIIRDGATINVSNFPSVEGIAEPGTGEAGNLTVEADSLSIEDGGRIDAATQAGNGGNITLDIAENITLRDTGFISARALQDANGGNINIDTNFIVAFPQGNNDIIATAERGNGGNINPPSARRNVI